MYQHPLPKLRLDQLSSPRSCFRDSFFLPELIEQDTIVLALHKREVVRSTPDELLLVQGYVHAFIMNLFQRLED
jgi:hypothetical protein